MKSYVCPKCFTQSPEPDPRGDCPACGHSTDGASILLWLGLTALLVPLLLIVLGTLYVLGLGS